MSRGLATRSVPPFFGAELANPAATIRPELTTSATTESQTRVGMAPFHLDGKRLEPERKALRSGARTDPLVTEPDRLRLTPLWLLLARRGEVEPVHGIEHVAAQAPRDEVPAGPARERSPRWVVAHHVDVEFCECLAARLTAKAVDARDRAVVARSV